jgi:hypothetical protein
LFSRFRGVDPCSAAHNAVGLTGSPRAARLHPDPFGVVAPRRVGAGTGPLESRARSRVPSRSRPFGGARCAAGLRERDDEGVLEPGLIDWRDELLRWHERKPRRHKGFSKEARERHWNQPGHT